jgi:hypothetical protein
VRTLLPLTIILLRDCNRGIIPTLPLIAAGRDNVIYGPFVVGHYSFFPQFKHMSTSPVLAEYQQLAAHLAAENELAWASQ